MILNLLPMPRPWTCSVHNAQLAAGECCQECLDEHEARTGREPVSDRFAEHRRLTDDAVARIVLADSQPWRLIRNMRLQREARALLAQASALDVLRPDDEPPPPR